MKGVILTINPLATIVDLSHQIPSHDIAAGAHVLHSCYRYFPSGTIHVAVVDPGVGSGRRPLAVMSSRYFFIAPDNGLLSHVVQEEGDVEVREIENMQFRLPAQGQTFDGRDVFAPAAAWLTKGEPFSSCGRLVEQYKTLEIASPHWEKMALIGGVIYVDRFGNLITNLTRGHVDEVRQMTKRPNPQIRVASFLIDGLVDSYADGKEDSPCAVINSDGRLEIFLKESSASARLAVDRYETVTLS